MLFICFGVSLNEGKNPDTERVTFLYEITPLTVARRLRSKCKILHNSAKSCLVMAVCLCQAIDYKMMRDC